MFSMTGYAMKSGNITLSSGRKKYDMACVCEIKSFNSKYIDINMSIPSILYPYEIEIRKLITNKIKRGKVYFTFKIETSNLPTEVDMDKSLLDGVKKSIKEQSKNIGIEDIMNIVPFDMLFSVKPKEISKKSVSNIYLIINEALDKLNKMRYTEGENTKKDLILSSKRIKKSLGAIKKISSQSMNNQYASIKENLLTLLKEKDIDESRLVSEAASLASRININEEIKRLESHIEQYVDLIAKGNSAKSLEFLAQEMHREANTISSKSQDIDIIKHSLIVRESVDEIKEQIRNVE